MTLGLDELQLTRLLGASSFGSPLRVFETIGSTNADALAWADDGAPEGALVVADHQTEGRGRKGRTWLSEPGQGLLFSLILRPSPERVSLLSTVVGVAACEVVRSATRLSALIKWPNDLVVEDRKIAGILVESRFSLNSAPLAIVGMGINVYQQPATLPVDVAERTTSIATEMERLDLDGPPSREALLASLVRSIEARYREFQSGAVSDLVTTAESLSSLVGREVVVRLSGEETLSGIVTGLDDEGRLELETAEGYAALSAGEVETVRRSGDEEKS